jgi:type II secretory pathway pseudopilin PulG
MKSTRRPLQTAFSIVELIAVIAVIAILVGLLVPALSTIQKMAANVSQKAQFATIGFGLEAYSEEMGDYPESSASPGYQGAQRLAEAMIGLDGFGFHPLSRWDGDDPVGGPPVYDPATLPFRKGPYLELDTANAVMISSIYGAGFSGVDSFILADKFKNVKNTATGKKTGMPILYFKANTINVVHPISVGFADVGDPDFYLPFIYSFYDNRSFIIQPSPFDGSPNPMAGVVPNGPGLFYGDTLNPNFTDPRRPYNNESYILLSAGADGFYGTKDDVYNFDNGK